MITPQEQHGLAMNQSLVGDLLGIRNAITISVHLVICELIVNC
jgi:hypothetical protein